MPPKIFTTEALQANTLKRGERVRLVADLPGIPAGALGKVAMANGFTWSRYWVRFSDGRVVGHINHAALVRARDFERFQVARDREAVLAEQAALQAADGVVHSSAAADAGPASSDDDEAVVNGVTVPAYLLQRSADARTRLSA